MRSMFDRIAPRYDLLNHLLSCGIDVLWRRSAVRALALAPPARALDVCTGTADLLGEFLRRDPRHWGVGVDLSERMLAKGAGKIQGWGLGPRAGLLSADAERLPLAAGAFDGALIAFGIRNVFRPEVALGEILRVLRPGGVLVILEFSMPGGVLAPLYRFYFSRVLPRVGALLSGDRRAYAYLPESVERFPTPGAFRALLERCGFVNVVSFPLTRGIAQLYRGERPT